MCKLTDKISMNIVSGYKVAYKIYGKYYSPATGIEYKTGLVTIPEKQERFGIDYFVGGILNPEYYVYEYNMVGRTCVFIDYKSALELLGILRNYSRNTNISVCILHMSISNDIMVGNYSGIVMGGRKINSFREYEG